jgi:hypothetical protein
MHQTVVSRGSNDGDRLTQQSFRTDRYGVHHNRWTGVTYSQCSKNRGAYLPVTGRDRRANGLNQCLPDPNLDLAKEALDL